VLLSTGQTGVIDSAFGQGGKFKVKCDQDLSDLQAPDQDDDKDNKEKGGKKKKQAKGAVRAGIKLTLAFKKYTFALNKRAIVQT
jgi:hypothetical protein